MELCFAPHSTDGSYHIIQHLPWGNTQYEHTEQTEVTLVIPTTHATTEPGPHRNKWSKAISTGKTVAESNVDSIYEINHKQPSTINNNQP